MIHTRRPRLLVISQVYVPDPAAVGQYLSDAAEEMARRGWEVVVYTSARGYDTPLERYPARERRSGVDVRRFPLSSFGKRSIAVRLAGQSLFIVQAFLCALFAGRFTAILVSTSPPFAGFFGTVLSILKQTPCVWWVMDLNPDQMVAAGKLGPNSLLIRVFDWMNRFTIRKARLIVVLDRFMKERLVRKVPCDQVSPDRILIVAPWSLDAHLQPSTDKPNGFRTRYAIEDAFVVMYSGNHSEQNPLTTLLDAADRVRDLEKMIFLFVGSGAGKAEVERRLLAGARNIVSLPYQPIETLADTLSAADVHVVSVGNSMVGIVHPCKIYSAMAVGRPILLLGPTPCHASDIMGMSPVGWHLAHGDVAGVERTLRETFAMDQDTRHAMNSLAASVVGSSFSRKDLLGQFATAVAGIT